jgi:hypothetical protein
MVAYSGTPLVRKLGIKSGRRLLLINPPRNYRQLLGQLPDGTHVLDGAENGLEFVHVFTTDREELHRDLKHLRPRLSDTGMLWVSWPKKSARVRTDVTEDRIRELALPLGLVDTKVCAVDETWSALKLVVRRENRRSKDQ